MALVRFTVTRLRQLVRRRSRRQFDSVRRGLAHGLPHRLDVHALGEQRADRHARHPAAVEQRGREIGRTRSIDAIDPRQRVRVERLARDARRFVADDTPSAARPARGRASRRRRGPARRATARWRCRGGDGSVAPRRPARGSGTRASARGIGGRAAAPSRGSSSPPRRRRCAGSSDSSTSRARDGRCRARSRRSNRTPRRATCAD